MIIKYSSDSSFLHPRLETWKLSSSLQLQPGIRWSSSLRLATIGDLGHAECPPLCMSTHVSQDPQIALWVGCRYYNDHGQSTDAPRTQHSQYAAGCVAINKNLQRKSSTGEYIRSRIYQSIAIAGRFGFIGLHQLFTKRGQNVMQSVAIDGLILLRRCSSRSIRHLSQGSNEPLQYHWNSLE